MLLRKAAWFPGAEASNLPHLLPGLSGQEGD